MDDIFDSKPNGGTPGPFERFGFGKETNTYGGSSLLRASRLSPTSEDYGEMFGSFHGSRASIPTIHIPSVEEAEVFFDVGTSESEYGEVFGEFDDLDFETPHEAAIDRPEGGDDDSMKEFWTPVGTEHPSSDSGDIIKPPLQVADNNNLKQDLSIEMGNGVDHQTQNGDDINASSPDSTFFAVSNIVLKSKPGQPPPCRPPPITGVHEDCMFSSSSRASASTYTPPSFFVAQLDVSSEAAASATSVEN